MEDGEFRPRKAAALLAGAIAIAAAGPAGAQAAEGQRTLKGALAPWFPVGAAVPPRFVDEKDPHSALLAAQFSALVAENAMKPASLQPAEGIFLFADADKIADFAERHGMALRGHTLVWHQQTPRWFFLDPDDPSKPASRDLLLQRMRDHISAVVGRYRGRVRAWDVVNEVLSDSGSLRGPEEGSKWLGIAGRDYIDEAFRCARAADPGAELAINDYNLESLPAKRDAMRDLVAGMLARGVPVDAVGMQMHISIYGPSVDEIRRAIEEFAALGVKVQVTEMDVSLYQGKEAEVAVTPELLERQGTRYAELFALFRQEAEKGRLDMVMLWGVSDDASWLNSFPVPGRANAPLLFDRKLQPKPALRAIVEGAR
jgi:endo-1,4-beta-xylanase